MSYINMEEDLTCPVCLELYADPLMMPCSHSVCKACLLNIMKSRAKADKQDLECPTCRNTHTLKTDQVETLPKNLALENIVFRYQEIQSFNMSKGSPNFSGCASPTDDVMLVPVSDADTSDEVFESSTDASDCGMCEEPQKQRADWFCQQCQVHYCQQCLDRFHPRRGTLREHKVCKSVPTPASGGCALWCHDHPQEKAHIFCDSCKTVACHLCVCQGQGAHCGHVILDIATAKRQLQDVLKNAREELGTLASSFQEKECEIASQLKNLKVLQETSRTQISSQYSCMLADIVSVLDSLKQRALQKIDGVVLQHFNILSAESQSLRSALAQCQGLVSACDSLVADQVKKQRKEVGLSVMHGTESSDVLMVEAHLHDDLSFSSGDGNFDSGIVSEVTPKSKSSERGSPVSLAERSGGKRRSGVDIDKTPRRPIQETEKPLDNANVMQDQNANPCKNEITEREKNRHTSVPSDTRRIIHSRDRSLPTPRPLSANIEGNKRLSNPDCVNLYTRSLSEKSSVGKNDLKKLDMVSGSRSVPEDPLAEKGALESALNERKISEGSKGLRRFRERGSSMQNLLGSQERLLDGGSDRGDSPRRIKDQGRVSQSVENSLLLRAEEVGPILEQVAVLCKETPFHNLCKSESRVVNVSVSKAVTSSISDFQSQALSVICSLSGETCTGADAITPAVRSVVSPAAAGGQAGARRVQSRTLITWGFNSTTFSADPVSGNAQWSVSVHRNTSHIGDIRSGYLFGLGVSSKCLGSKDQVGMNPHSYGVICTKGNLAFSHNSHVTPIAALTDLPVTVTLSVHRGSHGCLLLYRISQSSASSDICGRRIIMQADDKGEKYCENVEDLELYPVFTVSQRVKMQFPLTSDI
ncbi:uncharacterized protein LOC101846996 [Aplysia californica]|uniref:Uncharacterized protein LOC101846996 n=1 Tax=Aplysia californica TaxID=6500 RepID=A0ABM0K709_APLCA|nr:uncharacterized protein LOC101846996 [Aplysia californica]